MNVLVIDVGGTHVKLLATGRRTPVKFDSGPHLTPAVMVRDTLTATAGWRYDRVSIGYPGPVRKGRPVAEPHNLGRGWRRFDFARAFRRRVRIVNDAAMQALGSYDGGRMLFLGLGTGLGTAVVEDHVVQSLELAHLPYREGKSFEDYLGVRGLERLGRHKWEKHVHIVSELLRAAVVADHVVLGGGNVKKLLKLPPHARRGDNANAFRGGMRLWT
ncbi:MAG TPA: ROK family protein [Methylomirabilota bacterium]|nr:ROK family protein [Methylomirabilota bacterium]